MTQYTQMLKEAYGIKDEIIALYEKVSADIDNDFKEIEQTAEYNQLKVLKAFADNRISAVHFNKIGRASCRERV